MPNDQPGTTIRPVRVADTHRGLAAEAALKGGITARSTSEGRLETGTENVADAPGLRSLYLLAARGKDHLETPVFRVEGDAEGIAVFTDRSKAIGYIQTARWTETHEPADLSASSLESVLGQAQQEGVTTAILNPDRNAHLAGEPQFVLDLDGTSGVPAENLFRQIHALEDERLAAERRGQV